MYGPNSEAIGIDTDRSIHCYKNIEITLDEQLIP